MWGPGSQHTREGGAASFARLPHDRWRSTAREGARPASQCFADIGARRSERPLPRRRVGAAGRAAVSLRGCEGLVTDLCCLGPKNHRALAAASCHRHSAMRRLRPWRMRRRAWHDLFSPALCGRWCETQRESNSRKSSSSEGIAFRCKMARTASFSRSQARIHCSTPTAANLP